MRPIPLLAPLDDFPPPLRLRIQPRDQGPALLHARIPVQLDEDQPRHRGQDVLEQLAAEIGVEVQTDAVAREDRVAGIQLDEDAQRLHGVQAGQAGGEGGRDAPVLGRLGPGGAEGELEVCHQLAVVGRQVGDARLRREVLQEEDAEAVPRVEHVAGLRVRAFVGEQDGQPRAAPLAVLAPVLRPAEEHEVVDPVAQLGGQREEVDGRRARGRRVVDAVVQRALFFQREVLERDGEGLGQTVGPRGYAAGREGGHHYNDDDEEDEEDEEDCIVTMEKDYVGWQVRRLVPGDEINTWRLNGVEAAARMEMGGRRRFFLFVSLPTGQIQLRLRLLLLLRSRISLLPS